MSYFIDHVAAAAAISGIALAVLGVVLLRVDKKGPGTIAFALFAVLWGMQIMAANISRMAADVETLRVWVHVYVALQIPIYIPLIHFAVVHVRPTRFVGSSPVFPLLLSIPAVLILSTMAVWPGLFVEQVYFSGETGLPSMDPGTLMTPFVLLPFYWGFAIALALSFVKYERTKSPGQRERLVFIPAALAAFVAYITFKGVVVSTATADLVLLAAFLPGVAATLVVVVGSILARNRRPYQKALLLGFALVPALVGGAEAFLLLQGVGLETLALWRLIMVGLVLYGIARYRLFDIDVKLRSLAPPVGTWVVITTLAVVVLWSLAQTPFSRFPVLGVVSSIGLAGSLVPVSRIAAHSVFRPVQMDPDYLYKRKIQVYQATLEEAQARGRTTATDDVFLKDLRKRLGIDEKEHRLLLLVLQSQERLQSNHAFARREGGGRRFLIEREIGRGSFGQVYLAKDLLLDRRVVLKQPLAIWLSDERTRDRVLHEARLMAKIQHPNIAAVFEVVDDEPPTLVMEYVEGGNLRDLIDKNGLLPEGRVLQMTQDILHGLKRVHQEGIVHRDLKPENVLISHDGSAKVTDFGVAHAPPNQSTAATIATPGFQPGSRPYMSPEQARGVPVDARSDLYAVAVILFEMLTGRLPQKVHRASHAGETRRGTTAYDDMALHGAADPASVVEIRASIGELVDRALSEDPADRFPDAEAMSAGLRRVQQELEGEITGPPAGSPALAQHRSD